MESSYIVAARRTPIGKMLGGLSRVTACELGAVAARSAVESSGLDAEDVDEVIMGNVLSAGLGQAPARQVALAAGIPPTASALTVNMVCGSGLRAVMLADQRIRLGEASAIVAGGIENMSSAPLVINNLRGWKFGERTAIDTMQFDGLCCSTENVAMGVLADRTALQRGVVRKSQDAFAAESHRRAYGAIEKGMFANELVAVETKKGTVDRDEGPRQGVNPDGLAVLPAAFGEDGTATAGNSSQISDGAAAMAVVDADTAERLDPRWRARIAGSAISGGPPADLFLAPISAIRKVLRVNGLRMIDIDLFELNEAFASQSLACILELGLPPERVNVNGGAIALGHPIGASGARILVTLVHALRTRKLFRGLACLCLGGGNAVAMIVELER